MVIAKELFIGLVSMIFACGPTLAQPQPPGAITGRPPSLLGSEKADLIRTLGDIQDQVRSIRDAPGNSRLSPLTDGIVRSARWFSDVAARWLPKQPHEGGPLLASMDRMLRVLRAAPSSGPELAAVLAEVREDLSVKEEHCRAKGLATPQRVAVITKRNALDEVKGLEVLYIEKFFQSDPIAKPQQFRRFSSPAVDDLVPGKYVLWAKEPGETGRRGERKEARIGNGFPKEPIEVLAP